MYGLNVTAERLPYVWESPDTCASTFVQAQWHWLTFQDFYITHSSGRAVAQISLWVSGNPGEMLMVPSQINHGICARGDHCSVLTVFTLDVLFRSICLEIPVIINWCPHCLIPLVMEIQGADIWLPSFSRVASGSFPVQRTRGFS